MDTLAINPVFAVEDTQLEQALNSYVDRFGCNFPLFAFIGLEENKLLALIKGCVERGRPYKPRYKDGVDY